MVRPLFILSLPRAGSTLLQRLLSLHEEIATSPEPWIVLPPLVGMQSGYGRGIYGHGPMANAVGGFVRSLPGGEEAYLKRLGEFLTRIYGDAAGAGRSYFLDKTPRYHLVAEKILIAFPEAKFIFLWRNPLAVASSIITTWGKGKWNLYRYSVDLCMGVDQLTSAYGRDAGRIAVRYEDLVSDPEQEMERIFRFLGLEPVERISDRLTEARRITERGRGDPTGQYQYQGVSSESQRNWLKVMASPMRKVWARRYLEWIGKHRMKTMGYEIFALLQELDTVPVVYSNIASDLIRMGYGYLRNRHGIALDYRPMKWRGQYIGESG